jgi:type IX secretion system PorP/SprF family membrane protein
MNALKLIFPSLLLVVNSFAQDPNYSQFYNNPVYYNPAMTAINNGMTFRSNARNLWGPIPGKFNTYSATFESQSAYKMGLGLNCFSDVAGEGLLRTNAAYLSYSYRPIDTRNFILQAGLSGGFISKGIDWSKFTFSDQYDETMGLVRPSNFISPATKTIQYADFGTGIVLRFNGAPRFARQVLQHYTITAGGSINHLSQPKDAFMGNDQYLPMKIVGHLNAILSFNEKIMQPGFIIEHQNQFRTITVGTNFINRPLILGVWFRNRTFAMTGNQFDSFIFTIGVRLPDRNHMSWKIMYNYDFTTSKLRTSSFGSHEITLVMDWENKVLFQGRVARSALRRQYQCPKNFSGYQ